jgi:hypothetical protein
MDIQKQCTARPPWWASSPEGIVYKAPDVFHEGLSCTRFERMHNLCCGRNLTQMTVRHSNVDKHCMDNTEGWRVECMYYDNKSYNLSHMVKTALM